MNSTQVLMERRQIDAIIRSDRIYVEFSRRPKISTPAGGWRFGPVVKVKKQEVTLIPFKRRMTEFLANTEMGDVVDLPYVLLGRHDLDIQPGDIFQYQGQEFEVKTIDLKREVRTAAHVDYYGDSHA